MPELVLYDLRLLTVATAASTVPGLVRGERTSLAQDPRGVPACLLHSPAGCLPPGPGTAGPDKHSGQHHLPSP